MITKRMDGTTDAWDRDRLAVGFGFVYHPRLSRRLRIGSPCLPEVRDIDSLALAWNTRCGSLGAQGTRTPLSQAANHSSCEAIQYKPDYLQSPRVFIKAVSSTASSGAVRLWVLRGIGKLCIHHA